MSLLDCLAIARLALESLLGAALVVGLLLALSRQRTKVDVYVSNIVDNASASDDEGEEWKRRGE